jgi:outer membrane protein assembly factor BamB
MEAISRRQALSGLGGVALGGLALGHGQAGDRRPGHGQPGHGQPGHGQPGHGQPGHGRQVAGKLLWRAKAGNGDGDLLPLVAGNGMVYVSGNMQADGDCATYALDDSTGRPVWHTPTSMGPAPYLAESGAVYGFQVTGHSGSTSVVRLDARSGQPMWTYDAGDLLPNAGFGSMAYAGDTVFVGQATIIFFAVSGPAVLAADSYEMAALDAHTGHPRWTMQLRKNSSPIVAGDLLYSAAGKEISAREVVTGTPRWRSEAPAAITALNADAGVVYGFTGSSIVAFDPATGRLLWHLSKSWLPAAGTGGVLFLEDVSLISRITIHTVRAATGELLWSRTLPRYPDATAAANGVLYLGQGSVLTALAATTGDTLWTYHLAAQATGITTTDRAVYALDEHGTAYALTA